MTPFDDPDAPDEELTRWGWLAVALFVLLAIITVTAEVMGWLM